jgi:hypothetical protein
VPAIENQQPATLSQSHAIKHQPRDFILLTSFMQKICQPPLEKGNYAAIQHPAVCFILLLPMRIVLNRNELDTNYPSKRGMLGNFYPA